MHNFSFTKTSQAEDFYRLNEDVAAASEGGDGAATALLSSYLPSYPDGVRLKF